MSERPGNYGGMRVDRFELADVLKAVTHNAGCEGVGDELLFAVAQMTPRERGKLAALLGRFGYQTHAHEVRSTSEIRVYEAQAPEDARAADEGRKPRLIARVEDIGTGK